MKKESQEIRTGVIIAIVSALAIAGLGLLGWVLDTLYNQNGKLNAQGAQITDTQSTTHEILNILVAKQAKSDVALTQ